MTAVWANMRPLIEEPERNMAFVLTRMMPSMCDMVPAWTIPATCQKMLEARGAPALKAPTAHSLPTASTSLTFVPLATVRAPLIWNIQSCGTNESKVCLR